MSQYDLITEKGDSIKIDTPNELLMFSGFHFKSSKEKIIIVDIDDTLRNSEQRRYAIPSGSAIKICGKSPNLAWESFNSFCFLDTPLQENIDMVKGLINENPKATVVFLTSCTNVNSTGLITLAQLNSYGLSISNNDNMHLIMRGYDNQRTPSDLKKDFVVGTHLDQFHDERVLCIDDNQEVVDMFQMFGFETIKV